MGLTLATAAAAQFQVPQGIWIATAAGAVLCFVIAARLFLRDRRQAQHSLAGVLSAAAKAGRRLHTEAGELNPIGNLDRLDDLVRRYNAWEGRVADALASDDDVPAEWRDLWLRDPDWHTPQIYPYTRDGLDRMVRTIGHRLQLIDGMRRDLRRRHLQGPGACFRQ